MENKLLEDYLIEHSDSPTSLLTEIEIETYDHVNSPHMISGRLQGRLLSMISKMIRPNKILEIGTFTGYSAICLAEGLSTPGILHTIEKNETIAEIARSNFIRAGMENFIVLHIGDAIEKIKTIGAGFDLIFIDANKKKYIEYYKASLDILNKGGYILVDNVLWKNKVLQSSYDNDEYTKVLKDFNEFVKNDHSVEKIILPIRDGLFLIRKK